MSEARRSEGKQPGVGGVGGESVGLVGCPG
jgi:hypothetical protein